MLIHLGTEEYGWILKESEPPPPPPPRCPPNTHTPHTRTHHMRHTLPYSQSHVYAHSHSARSHVPAPTYTLSHAAHTASKTPPYQDRCQLCLTHGAGEDETQGVGHSAVLVHILVAVNHEPTPVKGDSNSILRPGARVQGPLPAGAHNLEILPESESLGLTDETQDTGLKCKMKIK